MSRDPDHAPFRDDLSSAGWDLLPLTYRPNSTFLTTPITNIWEAVQNVQIGVVWVASGLLQVIGNVIIRWRAYDFLYDCNRNWASISYRFRDRASYLSKVADFNPPTCIWRLRGGAPIEFRGDVWHQKTRLPVLSCGVLCVILRLAILVELRLVAERYRQTQTETQGHSIYRASIESRGKKPHHTLNMLVHYLVICR